MQSRLSPPSKTLEGAEAEDEEDSQQVSDDLRHEEEVDKETADYSADFARPQGAPDMSTPPTTSLNVIGGPRKTLKISVLWCASSNVNQICIRTVRMNMIRID